MFRLAFAIVATLAAIPPCLAQPAHLHVVLIADTNADANNAAKDVGLRHDLVRMNEVFEQSFANTQQVPKRRERLTLMPLKAADVTAKSVTKRIQDLKVTQGVDTVFVYYTGHGMMDLRKQHILTLSNGDEISRVDLIKEIQAKKPKLAVLITDACATFSESNAAAADKHKGVVEIGKKGSWQCIERLFFQHSGVVDFTSSSDGKPSYGNKIHGAVFTQALAGLLCTDPKVWGYRRQETRLGGLLRTTQTRNPDLLG